ncbi:Protein translocase subunit SA2, chloroplastic [Stylosanthes scabra]|uniref:chloroplast protein-transporting ATPase n=1 Tax=Stylosanthes scabra TaxID=79078 RepID=A0ABU6YMS2_9FABA|nr:Protein translocase subunit SA2, chloroplastic [Stylosanthes scabra]
MAATVPALTYAPSFAVKPPHTNANASSFIPPSFLSHPSSFPRLLRRRFTRSPVVAALAPSKVTLGGIRKSLNDFMSLNYWVVRDYHRLVSSVNSFEPHIQKLSDEHLTAKTEEFRRRLGRGETLSDIQAEAFAVVREAARRKLGMRHFDVQA